MALDREQVLQLLDSEEPDYRAAALQAGADSWDTLEAMVQEAEVAVAARAASLVATLAQDAALAAQALPAIEKAAAHADASVRAVAAVAAARLGAPGDDVVAALMEDDDPGVRRLAFRGVAPPVSAPVASAAQARVDLDLDAGVHDAAVALTARLPDLTLVQALLAGVIEYAHQRLTQLRAAVLGDVAAFAAALGMPAFDDLDGSVTAQLAATRAALDLLPPRLAAGDFLGAAQQLGFALGPLQQATVKIAGASLIDLLGARIDWAAAAPSGLARQLGLPAVPGLSIAQSSLVFALSAPARVLIPAPLTLGFDRADLRARLRLDGGSPPLSVVLDVKGIEAGFGGAALSSLLGGNGSVQADVSVGVDPVHGMTLGGGVGTRVTLPARPKLGPFDVRELALEVPQALAGTIDLGAAITTKLGGAIVALVDGAGLHVHLDPARVIDGDNPLTVSVKRPTGIGLKLDAGLVRGGGFLGERGQGYGGALQLRLGPVEVKAVGLVTLEPSFGLVVVMSIAFVPPIDLTFGFTLNAVGGVVAVEHRLDSDALRAGLADGALDHLMFPADPVAAAPVILSMLEHVFPFERGAAAIGPMVELGWGRPVSFLTAQLGVIVSLPDPRIVIVGRVRIALPAPQLPIVDLRATVYGEVTSDHLLVLVSLNGSRIAGFSVFGDMGLLLRYGGSPEFAISAGGFHPRYDPPRELCSMRRLGMDLSPPAVLTLRSESYFALTSNSVQLGSHTEMAADLGPVQASGHFTLDALVLFSPQFSFLVDVGVGLTVRVSGVTLLGVNLLLHVSGPAPWRAEGSAEAELLFVSVSVDIGPIVWGDDDNPPPLPADPRQLVHDAIHHNPGAWQALLPPDADRVVRVAPADASATEVTVHPMGMFDVRQHAVPLETVITRVGASPVAQGQQRVHFGVPLVNEVPAGALSEVTDLFSAGNFMDLTDDQKLSRPSFEPMPAGTRLRADGEAAPFAASREAQLRYETFVCDEEGMQGLHAAALADVLMASAASLTLAAGASGRSELRARSRYGSAPDPIVLAHPGEVRVVSKATVAAQSAEVSTYTHAAQRVLGQDLQLARLGVA
jgi:hypothetical protein